MPQQQTSLSPHAKQLSQQLKSHIAQNIEQSGGVISFAEFMQLALYCPHLGYYQNNLHKFGDLGDFVTAPQMGDLFAYGLAQSICSTEPQLSTQLLEIGAGSGQMAADILSHLNQAGRLPESYLILEPSASLQSLQRQTIETQQPALIDQVRWIEKLPSDFEGIMLANEVIDAIPVERIQYTDKGWMQLGVTINNDEFEWRPMGILDAEQLPEVLSEQSFSLGYTTEIRPLAKGWIKSISGSMQKGHIYLFDYGYPQPEYYHPQRTEGSLRCFSRHQANSRPLDIVGLQDITAHVDFTHVAKSAVTQGLEVDGFTTQAGFLLENKVVKRVEDLVAKLSSTAEQAALTASLSRQLQQLMAPGQMGELVKVISLSKQMQTRPDGFSFQDQLHRL